jgi:hypothetical protein
MQVQERLLQQIASVFRPAQLPAQQPHQWWREPAPQLGERGLITGHIRGHQLFITRFGVLHVAPRMPARARPGADLRRG